MSIDLSFLKQALPTIATALGGPFAGIAAGFIADKMGLSDKTVENITNVIAGAPPEQLVRIKEIDAELQKFFGELGIKELALENADRDSARQREMTVRDKMPGFLATIVTIGFFGMLLMIMFRGMPEGNKEVLYIMLGSLGTSWTTVMAYYFGSTKTSKDNSRIAQVAVANSAPVK